MVRTGRVVVLIGVLTASGAAPAAQGAADQVYQVGYRVYDLSYEDADGARVALTTAIWYPTDAPPRAFQYPATAQGRMRLSSKLAPDAPVSPRGRPFPLILFIHGAWGGALNGAYLAEHLATRGYVVAATDYVDTVPPDFKTPFAMSRIKAERVDPFLKALGVLRDFKRIMDADRGKLVWYVERFRTGAASGVLDHVLELGRREGSPLCGAINERAIGLWGHSMGGITTQALIGAHPTPERVTDKRIRAAVILSAGSYPFEPGVGHIAIPLMVMYGDNDPPMNPKYPRRLVYDRAHAPKYGLVLRDANHFSFGNPLARDVSVSRTTDPRAAVICAYVTPFFDHYLKGRPDAAQRLDRNDARLAWYRYDKGGDRRQEWGAEPTGRRRLWDPAKWRDRRRRRAQTGTSRDRPPTGQRDVESPRRPAAQPRADAPARRGDTGRHHVGFTILRVPDGAGKKLTVAFWYPTRARGGTCSYPSVARALEGPATRDAPAIAGRFPLVVFSHGGGGCGTHGSTLAEQLARHGFVVAAPDHHDQFVSSRSDGQTLRDPGKIRDYLTWAHRASKRKAGGRVERSFYEHRPRETRATIDAVLALGADPDSRWHGLVDPDRIGITGVSFGAWTTVACAGGIPLYHDRRIKAAAPIAGQVPRLGRFGIGRLRVPVMIVFGELETTVLGDETSPRKTTGMKRAYELARAPKFLVGIAGAKHLHFGAGGASMRTTKRVLRTTDVCASDPVMGPTCHYVLAFFRRYLQGDRGAKGDLLRKDPRLFVHQADPGTRR